MKAFLITTDGKTERVDIDCTLETYYRLLNCTTIDIATRNIGGEDFDIICDDEGLFNENPTVTAYNPYMVGASIVGNILIIGLADAEGNETELTDLDCDLIEANIVELKRKDGRVNKAVILSC